MNQKYQNALAFIGISILLLLLPLLLTAQQFTPSNSWTSAGINFQIERATLQELYQANDNSSFTNQWSALLENKNCNVCTLPEVHCNEGGLIQSIDLSDKNITVLPASIHNLSQLESLLLDGNALIQIPATLGNLTNLETLTIHDNQLLELPHNLRNLCGINVRKGLAGNPISNKLTWREFCEGI